MSEWYYARGGAQNGPVSFEQLVEIARGGGLDPLKDLVWTSTMKDWLLAGQIPGIFNTPANPAVPAADPSNPYATPGSTWTEATAAPAGEALPEIEPGSDPINVGGCIKRGFDLTCRHFGMILLLGIVYFGVTMGASVVLGMIDKALGWGQIQSTAFTSGGSTSSTSYSSNWHYQQNGSALNIIVSQLLSIFLSLGVTRFGLNLVSGKEYSIGMLFSGGKKLLPAVGASILYGLMVAVGFVLLIVPGVYLAIRYGLYLNAMVDRDLGVMDSFRYSSSITTNNRMNLFLLALLSLVIFIAGVIALCVGVFFAMPVVWLSWIVAYRWLQYGHRAALDYHGTNQPMLTGL